MSLSCPNSRYTTCTSFLEHCSTSTVLTYTVPTSYPISSLSPPPLLSQEDHALYSQTLFPSSPSTGFILSRIIEDGYTLELRWVAFTRGEEKEKQGGFEELDKHPATLTSVRFIFPSRLIPSPSFTYQEETLQVCAITEAGLMYTLSFATKDGLFYDGKIGGNEEWSEEFLVEGLQGKEPVLMKGAEEGRVVVACKDGTSLVVEIAEGQGTFCLSLDAVSRIRRLMSSESNELYRGSLD